MRKMNVFSEFPKLVQRFQEESVSYALVGGLAMAFYGPPRATVDIDILIPKNQLRRIKKALQLEGYAEYAKPWTFRDTKLTLRQFVKMHDEEMMIIDVLVAGTARHDKIVKDADLAPSASVGNVRVARREDLIWLKEQRNSKQDQADIERLTRGEG